MYVKENLRLNRKGNLFKVLHTKNLKYVYGQKSFSTVLFSSTQIEKLPNISPNIKKISICIWLNMILNFFLKK